jgi:hypothetical protein
MRLASLAFLAAAALMALEGQSPATLGAPPIKLNSCVFGLGTARPLGNTAHLQVDYGVVGAQGVKDVLFVVHWNDGSSSPAADVGNYAPGVSVRHSLFISPTYHLTTEAVVEVRASVAAAHLADGTAWFAPPDGGQLTRCAVYPTGR